MRLRVPWKTIGGLGVRARENLVSNSKDIKIDQFIKTLFCFTRFYCACTVDETRKNRFYCMTVRLVLILRDLKSLGKLDEFGCACASKSRQYLERHQDT